MKKMRIVINCNDIEGLSANEVELLRGACVQLESMCTLLNYINSPEYQAKYVFTIEELQEDRSRWEGKIEDAYAAIPDIFKR